MFAVAERGGLPSQSASAIRSVDTNRFGCSSRVASNRRGLAALSGWPWTWTSRRGPRIPYLRLSTRLASPLWNRPIVASTCTRREGRCTADVCHCGTLGAGTGGRIRSGRGDLTAVTTGSGTGRESWVGGPGLRGDRCLLATGEWRLTVLWRGGTRRRPAHRWLPLVLPGSRLTLVLARILTLIRLARLLRVAARDLLLGRLVVALVTRQLRVDLTRGRGAWLHLRRRLLAVDRADRAERDLRDRADLLVLHLEVAGLLELERARDQVRRERLDAGVVVADARVVEPAAGGDPVLAVGQLALQAEEVLVRLQLRVRLDRDHHLTQCAGQRTLRGGPLLRVRALDVHRLGAQPGDLLEHVPLVRRVRPHGLDQVRDEVVPPVQLDVDLPPRLLDQVPLLDES